MARMKDRRKMKKILDVNAKSHLSTILVIFITINIFSKVHVSHAKDSPGTDATGILKDKEKLQKLYSDSNGIEWKTKTNWMSAESICTWYGVTCNAANSGVTQLNLEANELSGVISMPDLLDMGKLQEIQLMGNHLLQFSGGKNTSETGKSSIIRSILVGQTQLSGFQEILPVDYSFPALKTLMVNGCKLNGALSKKVRLKDLSSTLEKLVLDNNNLHGAVPSWIGELEQLNFLGISKNSLTGELPEEMGRLKKLVVLRLDSNKFSSTIPEYIYNDFTSLKELRLGDNFNEDSGGFYGDLPSFAKLNQLERLTLDGNSIGGTVPDDFLFDVRANAFDYATLQNNNLVGTLPGTLQKFSPKAIRFDDNAITGISEQLCSPNRGGLVAKFGCDAVLCPPKTYSVDSGKQVGKEVCLVCDSNTYFGSTKCAVETKPTPPPTNHPTIYHDDDHERNILELLNMLTGGEGWTYKWDPLVLQSPDGSICDLFGVDCVEGPDGTQIESVEYLLLTGNNLVGEIPKQIYDLPNLKFLSLSKNDVMMTFEGIENAHKLESLDLASTNLHDVTGIGYAPDLLELHLENNNLEGTFPHEFFTLKKLQTLRLDYNAITGEIPTDIGDMVELKFLSIDYNSLSGSLPKELGQLTSLDTLRLKKNSLLGDLHPAVKPLISLSYLDVSDQNGTGFSGSVLNFNDFKHLRRLDLSGNSLIGALSAKFLSNQDKASFEFVNLSRNKLKGTVPKSLAGFHDVYLEDNLFTAIAKEVCDKKWGGPIAQFGCDAVLCPKGTYNSVGRQQSYDRKCEDCPSAMFLGSTHCAEDTVAELVIDVEFSILTELFVNCNGPNWASKTNWGSDKAVCSWEGIRCDKNAKINSINLRSNGLTGTLPPRIFELPFLENLEIDGNSISLNNFEGIEKAKLLTNLDLSNCNLPHLDGIKNAKSLLNLYVTSNSLRGEFPNELLSLVQLERLSLAMNKFTGTVPDGIQKMTGLEFLSLNNNDFSGPLPEAVSSLNNLLFLLLQENSFEGSIPQSYSKNLNNLWFLDLSMMRGSRLIGTLPSFSNFSELRRLDLHGNYLTGVIPDDFLQDANPDTFEYIDVSSNMLTGGLPGSLIRFPIDSIDFTNNKISVVDDLCNSLPGGTEENFGCDAVMCLPGTHNIYGRQKNAESECEECEFLTDSLYYGATSCIDINSTSVMPTMAPITVSPDALSEREILEILFDKCGGVHWKNKFHWKDPDTPICDWFGIECETSMKVPHVKTIKLEKNNLKGSLPSEIFQLRNLENILLEENKILVNFEGIGALTKLVDIGLSNTGVVSVKGISEVASTLRILELDGLNMEGPFPIELLELRNIQSLDLDNNLFTGTLPLDISLLTDLRELNINNNDLTGELPNTIGTLSQLANLDLADNILSGSVEVLETNEKLVNLDLSDQYFVGKLPAFSELKLIMGLDLSNNILTGTVPSNFLATANHLINYVDLSENEIEGIIPKEMAHLGYDVLNLADNKIDEIAPEVCETSEYGCDGILCKPGTCNCSGNEDMGDPCVTCKQAKFFGNADCEDLTETSVPTASFTWEPTETDDAYYDDLKYDGTDDYYYYDDEYADDDDETDDYYYDDKYYNDELGDADDDEDYYYYDDADADDDYDDVDIVDDKSDVKLLDDDATEKEILEKFYHAMSGAQWQENKNWLSDGTFCNWAGITCADKVEAETVESIHLGSNNLHGIPPIEIFNLPNLKSLVLYGNPLQGFNFNGIQKAKKLKELMLDATGISNVEGIGKAVTLNKLNLRFNNLVGVPYEITNLKKLTYLSLANNRLSGTLPENFEKMKNLEVLLLQSNHFYGELSNSRFPKSLRMLDLSKNELVGSIADDFLGDIPNKAMIDVDLSGNLLTGKIPNDLDRYDNLNINVKDNFFQGIANMLCTKKLWNEGDVGQYGCNAIMCPKGMWSPVGRATDNISCKLCTSAVYYGASECHGMSYEMSSGVQQLSVRLGALLSLLLVFIEIVV